MPIIHFLKKNWDSLLAATTGGCIILLFAGHGGIGISPDSVVYMTVAESLQKQNILADFNNHPVVDFPALYPIFLSTVSLLSASKILAFAPLLNAILFGLVIFVSGIITEGLAIKSRWYKRAMLCCVAFSPCLLEIYSMLWSETLFILLVLLFILALNAYTKAHSRKFLLLAALLAALATVTRYAGVTIIATGGLIVLLDRQLAFRRRTVDLILFSFTSISLLAINLVRNHTAGGSLTGLREKSLTPLLQNLNDTGTTFIGWLPFLHGQNGWMKAVALLVLIALVVVCIRQYLISKSLSSYQTIIAAFALLYILFMLFVATISRFEALNSRFFSPVFIPLLLCGSFWLVTLYHKVNGVGKKLVIILSVALFICFQYEQFEANYETWDGVKDAGIPGYTEDGWKDSETIAFVKQDSLPFRNNYTIYANANDAVYFLTKRVGEQLPHKDIATEVSGFLQVPNCYVIRLNDGENPDLVSKKFLLQNKKMKLLKEFPDGAIYGTEE